LSVYFLCILSQRNYFLCALYHIGSPNKYYKIRIVLKFFEFLSSRIIPRLIQSFLIISEWKYSIIYRLRFINHSILIDSSSEFLIICCKDHFLNNLLLCWNYISFKKIFDNRLYISIFPFLFQFSFSKLYDDPSDHMMWRNPFKSWIFYNILYFHLSWS
jgi:hypothetical protein